jgi:hypothetical protein
MSNGQSIFSFSNSDRKQSLGRRVQYPARLTSEDPIFE